MHGDKTPDTHCMTCETTSSVPEPHIILHNVSQAHAGATLPGIRCTRRGTTRQALTCIYIYPTLHVARSRHEVTSGVCVCVCRMLPVKHHCALEGTPRQGCKHSHAAWLARSRTNLSCRTDSLILPRRTCWKKHICREFVGGGVWEASGKPSRQPTGEITH